MIPQLSIAIRTEPFHRYFTRWKTVGHFPTSLEYRQAHCAELHARLVQIICDGPYDLKQTVETFPIVSDFNDYGWQQLDRWPKLVARWIGAIPLADQLRLSGAEVVA